MINSGAELFACNLSFSPKDSDVETALLVMEWARQEMVNKMSGVILVVETTERLSKEGKADTLPALGEMVNKINHSFDEVESIILGVYKGDNADEQT